MSVLEAAKALAPRVAQLAELGESERHLPDELVASFRSAGLFSMCVPASLGGGEVTVEELIRTIEAIAQADAAAAWCAMIQSTSGILTAYLAPEGTNEILAAGDAVLGGVYAPLGRAEKVEGGFRATGRWPFASGSRHCNWLIGGCLTEGMPPRLLVFRADEVTIHDTWHVSGLAGTGSNDFEVIDVFVPFGRTCDIANERPVIDNKLCKFPVFGLLALGIAAVALGTARGAIDDLLELAGAKTPTGSRRKLAERPLVQLQLAQAAATLGSARALVFETVGRCWRSAEGGEELTVQDRAELRLAATHATVASAQVVDAMYNAGGGTSIYRTSTLQRRFRDIHAATQHVMVGQPTFELAGRILLGLETDISTL